MWIVYICYICKKTNKKNPQINFDINTDLLVFLVFLTAASPCLSSPCLNGGTCVEAGDTYNCKCPDGFNGTYCEVELEDGGGDGNEGSGGLGKTDKRTDCAF